MTAISPIEHRLTSGDLVAELADRAPLEGANVGLWPGLTIYRFTEPTEPRSEEIRALSLDVVTQGRKAVMSVGRRFVYDQFNYLVISSGHHFECQILEASAEEPCLCFVLEVEPALVRRVSADMLERRDPSSAAPRKVPPEACAVSAMNHDLMSSVLRFLRSLSDGPTGGCWRRCTCRRSCTGCCSASSTRGCWHIAASQSQQSRRRRR